MTLFEQLHNGLEAYDRLVKEFWKAEQGELRLRLDELAAKAKLPIPNTAIENLRLHAESPPEFGLEPWDFSDGSKGQQLTLRFGPWRLSFRLQGWWSHLKLIKSFKADVEVAGVEITAILRFVRASDVHARLKSSTVRVSKPALHIRHVPRGVEHLLDTWIEGSIRKAVAGALPGLAAVQAIERLRLAAKAPKVTSPRVDMRKLAKRAEAISDQIVREHLPFGSLLPTNRLSFADGHHVLTYTDGQEQNSAIWTGHYVAAEAFRYAASRSKEIKKSAASNALRGLRGLEILIRVAGVEGLLSRVLIKGDERSPEVHALNKNPRHPVFRGAPPLDGYYSEGHVTRDQYVGAFLGTGMAYHHIRPGATDDAALASTVKAVRTLAKKIALAMTEYLLEHNWSPQEATLDARGHRETSVTFVTAPSHILGILQLARSLFPEKKGAAFEKYDRAFKKREAIAPVGWLFQWLDTLDPHDGYYKFNLEHSMALLLLGLEDDPVARRELAPGFRTMRAALQNHHNAYFNLVELTVFRDEERLLSRSKAAIEKESRHLMAGWLERPDVMVEMDRRTDPTIKDKVSYPGLTKKTKSHAQTIAREPLPVRGRQSTDFLWQRSPFELWNELKIGKNESIRQPGVDFILPYWMGRKLGIFAAG